MKFEDDLAKVEKEFPVDWWGSMLDYSYLKDVIEACAKEGSCDGSNDDERFFDKLSEEMQRINK